MVAPFGFACRRPPTRHQPSFGDILGRGERSVRGWENSDDPVPEPANSIIRFIYKERIDPSETLEEFSRVIAELQKRDKRTFELHLMATEDGWCAEDDRAA